MGASLRGRRLRRWVFLLSCSLSTLLFTLPVPTLLQDLIFLYAHYYHACIGTRTDFGIDVDSLPGIILQDITDCITMSLRHYRSLRRFSYGNAGVTRTTLPLNVKQDGEVVRKWGEACPSLSSCVLCEPPFLLFSFVDGGCAERSAFSDATYDYADNHTWIRVGGRDWRPVVVAVAGPAPSPQVVNPGVPGRSISSDSRPSPSSSQPQYQPPRTPQLQHQ